MLEQIACTALFSSRWRDYWQNCLVLWAHCENGKILMKSQDKGIFIHFGCLFFIWNTDITRMCSWFWAKWCNYFNVSCSVVELFKHRNHKNLAFNGLTPQKATLLLTNLFSTNNKSACVVVLEAILKCLTLGLRGIFARGWESAEALLIALVLEALNPVLGLIPDMYNNSAICAQCMCISWLKYTVTSYRRAVFFCMAFIFVNWHAYES